MPSIYYLQYKDFFYDILVMHLIIFTFANKHVHGSKQGSAVTASITNEEPFGCTYSILLINGFIRVALDEHV